MINLKFALLAAQCPELSIDAPKTDILEAVASMPPVSPVIAMVSALHGLRLVSRLLGFRPKKPSYLYMTNKHWRKSSRNLAERSRSGF